MKFLIFIPFLLLLSACPSNSGSGGQSKTAKTPPLSKDQAVNILLDRPCGNCGKDQSIEYFENAKLDTFSDIKISAITSIESLYGFDLLENAMDWSDVDALVAFYHTHRLFQKVRKLCQPADVPIVSRSLYRDLDIETDLDLLVQVDKDMRDIFNYVKFREPGLIDQAIEAERAYQSGSLDRNQFESKIQELKQTHVLRFESYDSSIADQRYVRTVFRQFEKKLEADKIVDIPSEGRLGWIGSIEFIRSQVVDHNDPLEDSTINYINSLKEKNKWDSLRYSGSNPPGLVNFIFPLPGESQSDFSKSLENLKVNLKKSQKCFEKSCIETLDQIQKELEACLK